MGVAAAHQHSSGRRGASYQHVGASHWDCPYASGSASVGFGWGLCLRVWLVGGAGYQFHAMTPPEDPLSVAWGWGLALTSSLLYCRVPVWSPLPFGSCEGTVLAGRECLNVGSLSWGRGKQQQCQRVCVTWFCGRLLGELHPSPVNAVRHRCVSLQPVVGCVVFLQGRARFCWPMHVLVAF